MIKLKNAVKMLASFSVLSLALSACSAETVEETAAPAAAGAAEEAAYDPASHIDYSGLIPQALIRQLVSAGSSSSRSGTICSPLTKP